MKEVIGGWIARDRNKLIDGVVWHEVKPALNIVDTWYSDKTRLRMKKKHGLKSGEIKRATLTVQSIIKEG